MKAKSFYPALPPGRAVRGTAQAIVCPAKGFTLLELIIVTVILVIIFAIGIPSLMRSRAAANEGVTVGSLRTVATFQAVFKQQAEVDQDGNGLGEYALLGELASDIALRPASRRLVQPIYVSQQFATGGSTGNGVANKSGYYYKMYLSNATAGADDAVGSDKDLGGDRTTGGPAADPVAISHQEHNYALYAWPIQYQRSGYTCFFINEMSEVYFTKMRAKTYEGLAPVPAANSAYEQGKPVFRSRIASGNTPGNDTNQWVPAGG